MTPSERSRHTTISVLRRPRPLTHARWLSSHGLTPHTRPQGGEYRPPVSRPCYEMVCPLGAWTRHAPMRTHEGVTVQAAPPAVRAAFDLAACEGPWRLRRTNTSSLAARRATLGASPRSRLGARAGSPLPRPAPPPTPPLSCSLGRSKGAGVLPVKGRQRQRLAEVDAQLAVDWRRLRVV